MTNSEYQDLIAFLGRKFEEIDRRFDAADHRFEGMEQRFEAGFEEIEVRLGDILGHFDHLYKRLERLEQEYHAILEGLRRIEGLLVDEKVQREELKRGVEYLKRQVAALQDRIEALEQRLHA